MQNSAACAWWHGKLCCLSFAIRLLVLGPDGDCSNDCISKLVQGVLLHVLCPGCRSMPDATMGCYYPSDSARGFLLRPYSSLATCCSSIGHTSYPLSRSRWCLSCRRFALCLLHVCSSFSAICLALCLLQFIITVWDLDARLSTVSRLVCSLFSSICSSSYDRGNSAQHFEPVCMFVSSPSPGVATSPPPLQQTDRKGSYLFVIAKVLQKCFSTSTPSSDPLRIAQHSELTQHHSSRLQHAAFDIPFIPFTFSCRLTPPATTSCSTV